MNRVSLPHGWAQIRLGELTVSTPTIVPADLPDEEFELWSVPAFDGGTPEFQLGSQIRSNKQLVKAQDVLLCKINPRINRVWKVSPASRKQQIASTEWIVVRPDILDPDFIVYLLREQQFRHRLCENVSGVGGSLTRVRPSIVRELDVSLPPLGEQRRIVDLVERLQAHTRTARELLLTLPELLEQYRQSLLTSAFRGELTAEWRSQEEEHEPVLALAERIRLDRRGRWEEAELASIKAKGNLVTDDGWKNKYVEPRALVTGTLPAIPESWQWMAAEECAWEITVGHVGPMKTRYVSTGIPFLRSQNVRRNRFDEKELQFIDPAFHSELKKSQLLPGDLVVVRSGSPGTACVIPDSLKEANCADLVIARLVNGVNPELIAHYINSGLGRAHIAANQVGMAQQHFNVGSMRRLPIPLMPEAEQKVLLYLLKRADEEIGYIEAVVREQLHDLDRLDEIILSKAVAGKMLAQNPLDEPAAEMLNVLRVNREREPKTARRRRPGAKNTTGDRNVAKATLTPDLLLTAFNEIDQKPDARRLFQHLRLDPDEVTTFYEILRLTPAVRKVFENASAGSVKREIAKNAAVEEEVAGGQFRLMELWLSGFKNLREYTVRFDAAHGLDVILGWNGTGKSNLIEAIVIILRDLTEWSERNRWPKETETGGYRLTYMIDTKVVEIRWDPVTMKRPVISEIVSKQDGQGSEVRVSIPRTELPLPKFVFGYYSGPTNRLAEHFQPMKQAHYYRLRTASSDDPETLAALLQQRRFFCAETHHAKYVLLAFCHKEDPEINKFLDDRLRITGFESALFIIRKPRWAKSGAKAQTFWGAEGVMRRVMERLRRFAIAPMVIEQVVSDGYRTKTEDHYYFFIPDAERLHAFAAEYEDARTFFVALESTDFSELIHDVKIQVRVRATNSEDVSITFREMSEGEQQLLMVLGLMRFTKANQSLVLLDEPDTHLNPHWSVDYLKLLTRTMSDDGEESDEQQTSQILISTHDPLVIASLVKEQVHLLRRDVVTGICRWVPASVNPRGLGFTGILTSEMFGFRSDLDEETLADLDNKVRLSAKEGALTVDEQQQMQQVDSRLEDAGFSKAFSDPYYAAFVRAWSRRHSELMAGRQFLSPTEKLEVDRVAREVLEEAIAEVQQEAQQ